MSHRVSTERIIECLRETDGLISQAAKRVPCSPTTIRTRARQVQAVQRTIDDCRDELIDYGELALRAAILGGEPWAVALVLKTLGKNRGYVERQEVSGTNGEALDINVYRERLERRLSNLVEQREASGVSEESE